MSAERLIFKLNWLASVGRNERVTTSDLSILVDGEPIWPAQGEADVSLEIQADDLLAYLTEFWKPLMLRQTYPISVFPERPSLLRAEAEKRWAAEPSRLVEYEDERVTAFEEAHDLSQCFAGLFGLPQLWLLRSSDQLIVETASYLCRLPFEAARDALINVGNEIADRLERSHDARWEELIHTWRLRDEGSPALLLAWSTGLDRKVAEDFLAEGTLSPPTNVTDAANDNDELRIAARMASALPSEQIRDVIKLVGTFRKHEAAHLNELSKRVRIHVSDVFAGRRPHEQGEAAATFVREHLELASVQFVDIFGLVDYLGIDLRPEAVQPPTLDALAVWGQHHGPAILLNKNSKHVTGRGELRRTWAARVTLAHELCHLLMDGDHTLSAVDVLNSRMPVEVERRAKAFAGEFLLPSRVAADIWIRMHSPRSTDGLRNCLSYLSKHYGVTQSVAAWKLEHGLRHRDVDVRALLDAIAPQR